MSVSDKVITRLKGHPDFCAGREYIKKNGTYYIRMSRTEVAELTPMDDNFFMFDIMEIAADGDLDSSNMTTCYTVTWLDFLDAEGVEERLNDREKVLSKTEGCSGILP